MKRHSALSLRKPEACSLSRTTAFNKHNIAAFLEKLKNVYDHGYGIMVMFMAFGE